MKKCAFCDKPLGRNASSEHILPQWLLDELKIRATEISPTHMSSDDGSIVSTRSQIVGKLVAGGICKNCNGGWMSQLESDAKPHLLKLFSNSLSVAKCDASQRLIIARWAFKTAVTLNLGSNFHKNIPKAHYTHIYNDVATLPASTIVVAQNHEFNQDFYWIQSPTWMVDDATDTFDETTRQQLNGESYKIGFQFRGLLIVVAFNPLDDYLCSIWRGVHVPLYPQSGRSAWYDRDRNEFPWKDSQKALFTFHTAIELFRGPS